MCTCILNILHGLECSSSSLTCSSSLFLFSHILFYTSTVVGSRECSLLKRNTRWCCWVRYRLPWKMCKIHEFRNLQVSQRQCKGVVEWCINSNCHAAMNRQRRRRPSRVYFSAFEKCKVQSEVNIEITTPREEFFSLLHRRATMAALKCELKIYFIAMFGWPVCSTFSRCARS